MKPFALIALVVAAACDAPEAPIAPSWQVDVMPLMAANCVRCHAYPFRGNDVDEQGMPRVSALRLDSFSNVAFPEGPSANGAGGSVQQIFRRTHDIALVAGQQVMPPDRPLDDYELAVIRNWANLGDGTTAIRGPGRADNAAPTLAITETARDATSVTFAYELRDADRDLVIGTVYGPRYVPAEEEGEEGTVVDRAVIGSLVAGRDRFVWNTAMVPPGEYVLEAELDDGADLDLEGDKDFIVVELGAFTLP